jgi:hypothetical protein
LPFCYILNYIKQYTANLVDSTYNKGAHFVLGTTKTLGPEMLDWLDSFGSFISEGYDIETSMNMASDEHNIGTLFIRGDKNQKLKF